jgi:hypothetical protein
MDTGFFFSLALRIHAELLSIDKFFASGQPFLFLFLLTTGKRCSFSSP